VKLHPLTIEATLLYEEAFARWKVQETHGPSLLTYNPTMSLANNSVKHPMVSNVRQEWVPRDKVEQFIRMEAMSDMLYELRIERKI